MTAKQLSFLILTLALVRLVFYLFPKIGASNLKYRRVTIEYLDSIVIAGVAALFIIHFLFRTFYIPSGSMIPTLKVNDYILVNQIVYRFNKPERGDIVVFKPPPEAEAEGKEFIKRIIAKGGDVISVKDQKVYVNGEPVDEPYVKYKPDYYLAPVTIPPGHFFVMGDNRPSSADSHIWGPISEEDVIGKAVWIILPIRRISRLK